MVFIFITIPMIQSHLYANEQYFAGKLHDYTIPEHEINASIDELEKII